MVIGAGVIGLELGSAWRRLGSEVIVLEYLDRILLGTARRSASSSSASSPSRGLQFRLSSRVTGVEVRIERDFRRGARGRGSADPQG